MTKPHTTLSEAVRALSLPGEIMRVLGESNRPSNQELERWYNEGKRDALNAAAALIEQHEAQEPKPPDLSKRLRETASCIMTEYGHAELMNKAADEIERYYGGMLNWKRTAEAQPTLAAAQAGDEKLLALRERVKEMKEAAYVYGDYSKDVARMVFDNVIDEIDAAMSPTTTRSE